MKERLATDDSKNTRYEVLKQIPLLYAIILKFSYQTRNLVAHGKFGKPVCPRWALSD